VWKQILLKVRTHKIAALILVIVTALSALTSTVFVYVYTPQMGKPCPSDARPFPEASNSSWTVFQLTSPGLASICLTVRFTGIPFGGLDLAPGLGIYTSSQSASTWSACSNSWTDCHGVTVSATPARSFLPSRTIHALVTMDIPVGSKGVYGLWFWSCSGGRTLWLRIGGSNQTLPDVHWPISCMNITVHVSLIFDGYTGMIPG